MMIVQRLQGLNVDTRQVRSPARPCDADARNGDAEPASLLYAIDRYHIQASGFFRQDPRNDFTEM